MRRMFTPAELWSLTDGKKAAAWKRAAKTLSRRGADCNAAN
jgi:hypothetical protein